MRGRELSASGHGHRHRGKNKPPKTSYFFRTKKGINSNFCSLGTKRLNKSCCNKPLARDHVECSRLRSRAACQISPNNACAQDVARFTTWAELFHPGPALQKMQTRRMDGRMEECRVQQSQLGVICFEERNRCFQLFGSAFSVKDFIFVQRITRSFWHLQFRQHIMDLLGYMMYMWLTQRSIPKSEILGLFELILIDFCRHFLGLFSTEYWHVKTCFCTLYCKVPWKLRNRSRPSCLFW